MGAICGVLGRPDRAAVRRMASAMHHRGTATHYDEGQSFCLASTSPIDHHVVLDGAPCDARGAEISARRLRAWCEGQDAETGMNSPRGAFAAVVGSDDGRQWRLMRDRLGRRPLYYFQGNDFVVFASELKAILASGLVEKRIDIVSVDRFLALRCVPSPDTILQGIRKVRPGHVLHVDGAALAEKAFAGFEIDSRDYDREVAAEFLRGHLVAALEKIPSAALLWSAGIDSAALAALRPGMVPVHVGLERAWQDEARAARESAQWMDLALEYVPARRLTEEMFARVVRSLDEPVADASVFPLWLIFERAAQCNDRVITGHGADELLGGYPRFRYLQRAHAAQVLVPSLMLQGLLPALPPNAIVRRGGRYLAAIRDNAQAYLSLASVFDREERRELYTDAMIAALGDHEGPNETIREHFRSADLTRNVLSLELNVGLPDLLLTSCEHLAAAHGVSIEFPYLDDDLVDFVATLSPAVKFGVRSKPLLRLAMKGILPPNIRLRAQRGFRIPQSGRLLGLIESVSRRVITPERVDAAGLFRWPKVEHIMRSASHNVVRRRQFWALLMFFAWYREIMES